MAGGRLDVHRGEGHKQGFAFQKLNNILNQNHIRMRDGNGAHRTRGEIGQIATSINALESAGEEIQELDRDLDTTWNASTGVRRDEHIARLGMLR